MNIETTNNPINLQMNTTVETPFFQKPLQFLFYFDNQMWMKKNWKCVAIGTTSIGLLYLAYTLWKRIDSTPKKTDRKSSECSIDDQRLRTVHSNYSQFYFDKTQQLQQILGLISEKGPTPEEIYLLSPAIIVD